MSVAALPVVGLVVMNVRLAFFVASIFPLCAFMSPVSAACVGCGAPPSNFDFGIFSQYGDSSYSSGGSPGSIADVYGSASIEAFGKVGSIDNFVYYNAPGGSANFDASGADTSLCNPAAYVCGDPIAHDPSTVPYDGGVCNPAAYVCGGPIVQDPSSVPTPTPVPATLPLFISGLGMLGYLRLRRKSKACAVVAEYASAAESAGQKTIECAIGRIHS